jgi:hypothetical protein
MDPMSRTITLELPDALYASVAEKAEQQQCTPEQVILGTGIWLDCVSFAEMRRRGITEALTRDHHFEQAGFERLLR